MAERRILSLADSLALSLEVPPELVPHFGDLSAGCDVLGGSPQSVVRLLRRGGISAGQRVIDLGCGQGAIAVAVVGRLGVRVLGVDGHPAFIERAQELAAAKGAGDACRFECADIRSFASRSSFDAALLIACGSFVGGLEEQVRLARKFVRAGGVIVIDDARPSGPARAAAAEARAMLERFGDTVIHEINPCPKSSRARERRMLRSFEANARALIGRHPELTSSVRSFLQTQRAASADDQALEGWTTWLLRRGRGRSR